MIIEAQNKEFFLDSPNNIHITPLKHDDLSGGYLVVSDTYTGTLLLGKYADRGKAIEVYEEIKKLTLRRKKYYLMPRE